ncbi:PL29 family lyase N-terminal domain-containing protein [Phocaeicola plebeius]|uniref:PL29 family lyase N-terminal domain-containing protein n=1 Tax=Phocaeicola plebeius TaxID=310297 RepID=UPI0026EF6A1D|nr:PL29 family lyase N-terminal domain-containing protein [Phocaeicola plebeius]
MKYIKSYIFLTLMVVSLVGCKVDDLKDDVNDLKDRVTLMEKQVKILNDNVEVMAYVLDTQQKTISKVEPSADKSQFTITLSDGYTMTLTVGKAGEVVPPTISVDENGYWVVNGLSTGVKAVGEDGNNGEGYPEFRVYEGKWQVRFGDGGWSDVDGGDLGTGTSLGDQFFESASLSDDGTVFTIVGTKGKVYTFPVVASLVCEIDGNETVVEFDYDSSVQEFDVKISGGEPLAPIYPAGWRAELTKKEADNADEYNYTLTVYAMLSSRAATADNTSDIVVRVNNGTLWAVDKLQVKMKP